MLTVGFIKLHWSAWFLSYPVHSIRVPFGALHKNIVHLQFKYTTHVIVCHCMQRSVVHWVEWNIILWQINDIKKVQYVALQQPFTTHTSRRVLYSRHCSAIHFPPSFFDLSIEGCQIGGGWQDPPQNEFSIDYKVYSQLSSPDNTKITF